MFRSYLPSWSNHLLWIYIICRSFDGLDDFHLSIMFDLCPHILLHVIIVQFAGIHDDWCLLDTHSSSTCNMILLGLVLDYRFGVCHVMPLRCKLVCYLAFGGKRHWWFLFFKNVVFDWIYDGLQCFSLLTFAFIGIVEVLKRPFTLL